MKPTEKTKSMWYKLEITKNSLLRWIEDDKLRGFILYQRLDMSL